MKDPDTPLDASVSADDATTPPSTPMSRAERRAAARAGRAVRGWAGAQTRGAKRELFDAAANMRRAQQGGSGRVTPKAHRSQGR